MGSVKPTPSHSTSWRHKVAAHRVEPNGVVEHADGSFGRFRAFTQEPGDDGAVVGHIPLCSFLFLFLTGAVQTRPLDPNLHHVLLSYDQLVDYLTRR